MSKKPFAKTMFRILLMVSTCIIFACSHPPPIKELHASEGYIKSDGAKLFYRRVSHRDASIAVIFVHGSAGNSLLWEQQQTVFAKAGLDTISFDLRNSGLSQPEPGQSSSNSIAEDIEAIRAKLNLEAIVIVGQAQGAEGAIEYSVQYPERTEAIVIAASYRAAENEAAFVTLRDQLAPPASFIGRSGLRMRLSQNYLDTNPDGVARFIEIDEQNARRQSVDSQLDAQKLKAAIQSPGIELNYATLAKIKAPVLVLSAQRDDVTPPQLMLELSKHIRGAKYQTVAEAGRYAMWENPDEFNTVVLDFINSISD
jgi:pimeloyl-ACP methyl ester carboxylesterase